MQGFTSGHFDEQGNACLKFHIRGTVHDPPGIELSGIIDTGFTGFISLPIEHAFSLKLPLEGTALNTLADNSPSTCYTAIGTVTYDEVELDGVVQLEEFSGDVLIGMAFLRQFKLGLMIVNGKVNLVNEDWLEGALKKAAEARIKPSSSSSS